MAHNDTPVIVTSDQARQLAIRELSKPQYHRAPPSPSPTPSTATPSPPPPHANSSHHALTITLIVLAIILLTIALVLFLRWLGRPRASKKSKPENTAQSAAATAEELLTPAARHRRNAEIAAGAENWAEAIRERFRAVIATLDERGLLPERADRTADEAARDAGVILPAYRAILATAARAFDEVEYGEYVGTPDAYAVISNVDELVRTERPGTLQLPTAVAPTIPGGIPRNTPGGPQ